MQVDSVGVAVERQFSGVLSLKWDIRRQNKNSACIISRQEENLE